MDGLLHLALIWGCVYVAIFLANKTRLTPVLFYLAMGALLVNVGVLPHEPLEFIRDFAEFGIILVMFALGFEENTSHFLKSIKRSWGIALFGALAPFTYAYLIADYFWNDTNVALVCGLAMTATAVSLTMVVLKSVGLNKSKAATGIMSATVLDAIASLIFVAILIPIVTGAATLSIAGVSIVVVKAVTFFTIISIIGLWVFPHTTPRILDKIPLFKHINVRNLLAFGGGEYITLGVLIMAVLGGILAHYFGFHPAIGAYMAGLILKEEYFQFKGHENKTHFENTRAIVDNIAFTWIGPVFFVVLGTQIIFEWDVFIAALPHIIIFTVGLIVVQTLSASIAARYTGGFDFKESVMIGFSMLGRAELFFVVLDIAYVQYSIINKEVFFTLMATAFCLNVAVPIFILLWKPYFEGEKKLGFLSR